MIKIILQIAFIAGAIAPAFAQTDSSKASPDSAGIPSPRVEELLDQSDGFDGSSILEYLRESRSVPTHVIRVRTGTQISQRLQPSSGYLNGNYEGSRLKFRQRATVEFDNLSSGFLIAKDAGERTANAFVSGYFSYRGEGLVRGVTLGDYRIEAGQGIALWKGRDFSKGSDILIPASRDARGVVPSLSSDESTYLRGAALEASLSGIDAVIFASAREYAASVDTDRTARALDVSGYYRTQSEVQKRGALTERLFGARISDRISAHRVGLTLYHTIFSLPLSLGGGARFAGTGYSLVGIDYAGFYRGISVFAEGVAAGRTFAGIGGFALLPSGGFSLAVAARAYPASFYSAHGSGFGDLTDNANEYGMYIGAQAAAGGFTFYGYVDHIRIPVQQLVHFPASGNELNGGVRVKVTEQVSADIQYHRSSKVTHAPPEDGSDDASITGGTLLQRLRVQGTCRLGPGSEIRIRCERSFLDDPSLHSAEKGFLVYGDLTVRLARFAWTNLRLALFSTDSYATRIIEYERDLNGVASIPSLYGSGVRWYLLVRLTPLADIQMNFKYSDLIRDDVRSIGTALEALTTNHDDRLSAEIEMTF